MKKALLYHPHIHYTFHREIFVFFDPYKMLAITKKNPLGEELKNLVETFLISIKLYLIERI